MEMNFRNLQKKRTANFREDETKLLIQLWGSPVIQNKLFLTHRKAPVMRILAANMQERGFYRTPDEIKTRIRNLKCLYHRIKRTMSCGTGIGTVDPDWPHFKAMDAILCKENLRKSQAVNQDESFLEGPKCEDIKQEIEDIDIHDDMESMATNDSIGSDYDETPSPPPLKPAPNDKEIKETSVEKNKQLTPKPQTSQLLGSKTGCSITPSFTIPVPNLHNNLPNSLNSNNSSNNNVRAGTVPSIPLLILNSVPQPNQEKKDVNFLSVGQNDNDLNKKLKQLVEIQKEKLKVEQKRLEIEKQRLDFDRLVGSQLLTLVPMVGSLIRKLSSPDEEIQNLEKPQKKRKAANEEFNSKFLKSMIQGRIKKYILGEEDSENETDNEDDSGIHNDENSNSSSK